MWGRGGRRGERATKDLSFCLGVALASADSLSDAFRGLNDAVWACGDAIHCCTLRAL